MKWDGERVVPDDMHNAIDTLQQHLLRYVWALQYCKNKVVVDAACGTGYGTALLKQIASAVRGYDIDSDALNYAVEHYGNYFYQFNLEEMESMPGVNVVVTFETIEHLKDPKKFLEWCKSTAPLIIGSIPISCPTKFHKHVWNVNQIKELIGSIGFSKVEYYFQDHLFLRQDLDQSATHGMVLFVAQR